jgi:pro-kumamolisin-like protein
MKVKSAWSRPTLRNGISRNRWTVVCAAILAMASTLVSQTASQTTQTPDRITQSVNPGEMVKIAGTVRPLVRQATDLGEVSSGMQMNSLSLNIGLSTAQQTQLAALLAAQQDPKSPQYHQWLTQEEYGASFGLTDTDLSKLTAWLEAQGFTVNSVAPSRNLITFSGAVPLVEGAFQTQIHRYLLPDGTTHISNTADISIPKALSGVVINVRGLNNFRPHAHATRRLKPDFTSSTTGEHYLAPADWSTIYNVNPIYSAGYTGTAMHVGVAGQTYIPLEDITNFRAAAGLTAPLLNMVCISTSSLCGASGAPDNEGVLDVGEADLDVEWSGGIAKNATVDFIYAAEDDPNLGVFDALVYGITTYQVGGAVVPVIGVSYGDCEYDVTNGVIGFYGTHAAYDVYLEEAAGQGQTIVNSSGDDGAGCTDSTANQIATNGASVSWPSTSPYVTAVGGTAFDGDGSAASPDTGADQYWSYSGTADILDSALQYIPETSWNDTAYDESVDPSGWMLSASGGGVSTLYALPSWQSAPGNYTGSATNMRYVPDIAFSASADHDGYLVCTQNFTSKTNAADSTGSTCVNGFRDPALGVSGEPDSDLTIYGGTSASAQVFSGLMTLLVQAYGKQGNISPTLYSLAKNPTTYAQVFHDTTTGNNIVPCTTGTTGCIGGDVGYSAATGYDLVTGLGSVNGGALFNALAPAGAAATYTLSPSTTSISVADGGSNQVQLNLNSANYAGTVSFTTSVTLNGVSTSAVTASASPVALASDGTGSTMLTITAASSAANHLPAVLWRSGGALVFAIILGAPWTGRRKQSLVVLLTALAIAAAGFLISCGGSSGSSTPTTAAHIYSVTVTPTGTGGVTNPSPVTLTVTVP